MPDNKVVPEDEVTPSAASYDEPPPSYANVTTNGSVTQANDRHPEKPPMYTFEEGGGGSTSSNAEGDKDKDAEKKEEEEVKTVGVFEIFRYADCLDVICMIVGTICALAHGAGLPGLIIIFGDTIDLFVNNAQSVDNATQVELDTCNFTKFDTTQADALKDESLLTTVLTDCNKTYILDDLRAAALTGLLDQMGVFALRFVYIGLGVAAVSYGQVAFWLIPSYRQSQKIRTKLFRHIMRQEIGWFDTHKAGELNTRLADDINKIQEGIGDKISNFFQWFSTFLVGIVIGFVYGWKLTLVIMATSPLLVLSGIFMTALTTSSTQKELDAYAKAGSVAEQAFSSIRTVVAFGGEDKESERYNEHLDAARSFGIRKGMISGLGMGFVFFIIFGVYALAFWYGAKLVREEAAYSVGRMIIVFFCVLIGAFALGNAAPNLTNMGTARGAAYKIWELLKRESLIDSSSEEGVSPPEIVGNIQFKDIVFRYPSRPDIPILNGLTLDVNVGKTVALVGSSGCGKSTTVQLLQRFYDPLDGSVMIDDRDIRDLNIKWLRQHIGVVSQEPVLFDTTIMENIKFGRDGVTDEQVVEATKKANAYNFIKELPDKYETLVGERGAQLSGGQKQRIAIARALVRDPKILLLDEATSALDTESEAMVQEALDKARLGRTTIVIAHRLSTIKTADLIYSLQDGKVYERGTHAELMGKGDKGIYCQLVNNQKMMEDESGHIIEEKEFHEPEVAVVTTGRKRGISEHVTEEEEKDTEKEEKKEEEIPEVSMMRVMAVNASEWYFILIGCIASICNGAVQPAYAIIFSEIIGVFALPAAEQEEKALLYSMLFLAIAVGAGIAQFLSMYMFALSGETLTSKIRGKAFRTLLKQEIAYYDDHDNSTGALCTRLATDASAVQGATGVRLGTMCMSLSAIGAGIVIGFIYSWKLTLAIMGSVPFLMAAGIVQMQILGGQAKQGQEALEAAGKVSAQVIENMRTVASLTKEPHFDSEYSRLTGKPYKSALVKSHLIGITFGLSEGITFFVMAGALWFGAWLVENDGLEFVNMFKVFAAIVFGAMGVGQAVSFAPDYDKAKVSANRIFFLFDRVPSIDSSSPDGKILDNVTGTVDFNDVHFRYPTRPTVPVLQGLTVSVRPKQVLAFVGSSGCGKSTSVSLIERFYEVESGVVSLDGEDIKDLNLKWLRSQMGIVQQEPMLFDMSIRENIAYGDNSREVTMDEVIKAARDANIHNFIDSLPNGYDTNVGDKGAQLSGGQKQRVAIARALVRDPKILLLDEATSALDTESEKVVQEALDRAQQGRTTIVIAHRLSTIQNADCITVIQSGKVAESGTHSQLMAKKGIYFKLNFAQQRKGKK